MSALKIPSLALSALLQFLPIVRVALPATPTAANFVAIIFRWSAAAAAMLGGVQAVSGASTVITTPLNQTVTNGVPLGSTQIRLITAPEQAHYWLATGLPPGLNLSGTSGSTSWKILGTPTATGTYNVRLTAKENATSNAERTTTATMVISVLPGSGGGANAPPTANQQNVTTAEDSAKAITLSGSDPDGDALTYAIVAQPAHGTLSGSAPNVSYSPAANYNGPDSFTFRVNDGATNSPPATVSITVTAVNDAPVANAQSVTTTEDTAKAIQLTGSDVEGGALTYSIVDQPTHGTLSGTAPSVTYLPAADYNGPDSFTFRVNDGAANSSPETVSVIVTAVNDAPVANSQSVTTAEDTPKAITLSGSDVEGTTLTYSIVTQPSHGTVTGTAPNIAYTPAANYEGADALSFRVSDGLLNSTTATVSITVTPVNDAPAANAQSVSTPENTSRTITLTGSDAEGSVLSYVIVAAPTHGSLTGTAPNVLYTPNSGYSGADAFTFRVNDGNLDSAVAAVSINVSSVNTAPVANSQGISTPENSAKAITLTGSDADGDTLTYTVLTQPAKGALTGSAPSLTYTPNANAYGADSFTFKVNDGTLDSAPANVSITIIVVDDPPTANYQSVTTAEDTAEAITLSGSDPEGNPLAYAIVTQPAHGTLTGSAPNLTYAPSANYNGPDSFTFKVNDGGADSTPATVAINVTPVNDPPVATNITHAAAFISSLTFSPLSGSTDPDGDSLSVVSVSATNGTAVIQGGSNIAFTAGQNFVGTAYVGYTISDGQGGHATGLISIILSAVSTNQFTVTASTPVLNPQTGLQLQLVNVTNVGSFTVAAIRLTVEGLRSGVTLYNASSSYSGDPCVQYDAPLSPGQGVTFVLEYYVADRMPFTYTFEVDAVLPSSTNTGAGGAVPVNRSFLDRSDPANPRFTIEFATIPGRTYSIVYTDDLINWRAATPSLTASASVTQWHDDGPPKTLSKPGGGNRFYGVLPAP